MKTIKKLLLICVCLLSQQVAVGVVGTPLEEYFPFVVVTDEAQLGDIDLNDEEFYERSRSIIFRVGSTVINSSDDFVRLYEDSIVPIVNQRHLQLRKVCIRGAASPEGPYANNQRLGKGRAKALLEVLQRHLLFQEGKVEVSSKSVTEDYGYLCLLMRKAADPDYDFVYSIYQEANGDERICKRKLQAAQGGKLWKRLLREYFPQLRAARFVLWFHDPHYAQGNVPRPIEGGLGALMQTAPLQPQGELMVPLNLPPLEEPVRYTRRHLIALRTNLLADLWYQPQFGWAPAWNIQAEYYPLDGHYTYNLSFTSPYWHKWSKNKFFQIRDYRVSLRRYFKGGGEFIGWFANAYAEYVKFGIGFNAEKGWQGEGGGGGLGLGYVTKINRRGNWRLEFILEAGFLTTKYDPYVYGNPVTGTIDDLYYYRWRGNASDFKKRNYRFSWFGPTMVGVQLTYDVFYRKKKKM